MPVFDSEIGGYRPAKRAEFYHSVFIVETVAIVQKDIDLLRDNGVNAKEETRACAEGVLMRMSGDEREFLDSYRDNTTFGKMVIWETFAMIERKAKGEEFVVFAESIADHKEFPILQKFLAKLPQMIEAEGGAV